MFRARGFRGLGFRGLELKGLGFRVGATQNNNDKAVRVHGSRGVGLRVCDAFGASGLKGFTVQDPFAYLGSSWDSTGFLITDRH